LKARHITTNGTWRNVADCANITIGRDQGTREPSSNWKMRILLAEHSPIRSLWLNIILSDIKYWASVHLTRHKIGVEHFVTTQREDRTGSPRDDAPQSARVNHRIMANAQAMINISRKRLCYNAAQETREAWEAAVESIKVNEPELYCACVPDCVYRGHCFEMQTCGYYKSDGYKLARKEYVIRSGR